MLQFNKINRLRNQIPEGIAALFLMQLVSTLSFSVLYSTLVLYMQSALGIQLNLANSIMGVFIALNFALHLLGGFLGGRLLSYRFLFCVGMIAQLIGCLLLSISSLSFFYCGLAAFLTGSGLNVTCLNCMLTQRFTPGDVRREMAFLWNYAAMNIGFFVGFTLSGLFQISQNYHELFMLSSLGNFAALLICLFFWHQLADKNTSYAKRTRVLQQKATVKGLIGIMLLPLLLTQVLQYANLVNKLVLVTGGIMFALIIYLAYQQPVNAQKNKILAFAALMVVGTIFWMLFQIGPMGLTVFIDHNVHREFTGIVIPPQWFQNINTIVIVVGGPLLGYLLHRMRSLGYEINIPTQFALALLFIGCAFIILPLSIFNADVGGMVNPLWIVASYVLQSLGELLISPIGYAMIGFLAPASMQGIMMGMWMLNSGVGATLASFSSNLMISNQNNLSPLTTNTGFSHVFLNLGLFALASSFVLFLFIPRLKALIQEKKWSTSDELLLIKQEVTVCE